MAFIPFFYSLTKQGYLEGRMRTHAQVKTKIHAWCSALSCQTICDLCYPFFRKKKIVSCIMISKDMNDFQRFPFTGFSQFILEREQVV